MKKFLLSAALLAGIFFAGNVKAQDGAADPNAPVMNFKHDSIDYGTIAHNADGYRYFDFTNTGKEPLIIKEAHGSCGCTIPTWPKEPIQPGQSEQIKVHYATDRVGRFQKTVTITSNANPGSKVLYIMGNVLPDAQGATSPAPPQNPAVPITNKPAGGR